MKLRKYLEMKIKRLEIENKDNEEKIKEYKFMLDEVKTTKGERSKRW